MGIIIVPGFPGGSDSKESVCNAGEPGLIPGLGRSSGEGNVNPLQHSCLENLMDRGAWRAMVHGVSRVRHGLVTKTTTIYSETQERSFWRKPDLWSCSKWSISLWGKILVEIKLVSQDKCESYRLGWRQEKRRRGCLCLLSSIRIISISFYVQNCLNMDDKLYGHQRFRECYFLKYNVGARIHQNFLCPLRWVPGL